MTGLSLANIHEMDAVMRPVFVLWENEEVVKGTGNFLGRTDIEIPESKNHRSFPMLTIPAGR